MITFKKFLNEAPLAANLEYHDTLNQKLWDDDQLRSDVSAVLNKIAKEFIEFLEVRPVDIKDIIITGSNCAFAYTSQSDIDLHIVIDIASPEVCATCTGDFIDDCFQAKKALWNSTHDITIYGYDIELYPQKFGDPLVAAGVYSLQQNKWLSKPKYEAITYDSDTVVAKASGLSIQIDKLIDSQSDDIASLQEIKDKIRKMRKAGLEKTGEFSTENLAFKVLRNSGYIDKLSSYIEKIKDKSLSLE